MTLAQESAQTSHLEPITKSTQSRSVCREDVSLAHRQSYTVLYSERDSIMFDLTNKTQRLFFLMIPMLLTAQIPNPVQGNPECKPAIRTKYTVEKKRRSAVRLTVEQPAFTNLPIFVARRFKSWNAKSDEVVSTV